MKSKRPQDTRRALQRVLRYMGAYKWTMAVVAVYAFIWVLSILGVWSRESEDK